MSVEHFKNLNFIWLALSVIIFFVLLKITAPYGRHTRKGWGPSINNTLGWVVMEITSPFVFAYFFLQGGDKSFVNWIFFALWVGHYFNRSIIFPFRLPDKKKEMPLMICLSAVFFNSINGFINGYYLGVIKFQYELTWMSDPRFIVGILLFITGFIINNQSDNILINLRKRSSKGEYQIPKGGFYRWISSPNYFGEIIEWTGWALATWSLPGLTFAVWTAANLIPRALSHHQWYRAHFQNYPSERKAIFPKLL